MSLLWDRVVTVAARAALPGAAVLALAMMAGCGAPEVRLRYETGGPDEVVAYDSATFQLARGLKVQVVLFRQTAAPIGTGDTDFEYVFFELPERDHYGWLREDHVPAYRWVRADGRDHLWLASAGQVRLRMDASKRRLGLDFRMTMEPLAGTPGGGYVLEGDLGLTEDAVRTQGLINRYGEWIQSLLKPRGAALPVPAGAPPPASLGKRRPPAPPAAK